MIGVRGKNCMGRLYMMFVRMKVITKSILFKSVGDEKEREKEMGRSWWLEDAYAKLLRDFGHES